MEDRVPLEKLPAGFRVGRAATSLVTIATVINLVEIPVLIPLCLAGLNQGQGLDVVCGVAAVAFLAAAGFGSLFVLTIVTKSSWQHELAFVRAVLAGILILVEAALALLPVGLFVRLETQASAHTALDAFLGAFMVVAFVVPPVAEVLALVGSLLALRDVRRAKGIGKGSAADTAT
jgi:hypothetical protein